MTVSLHSTLHTSIMQLQKLRRNLLNYPRKLLSKGHVMAPQGPLLTRNTSGRWRESAVNIQDSSVKHNYCILVLYKILVSWEQQQRSAKRYRA
jgi:hypothetical protein